MGEREGMREKERLRGRYELACNCCISLSGDSGLTWFLLESPSLAFNAPGSSPSEGWMNLAWVRISWTWSREGGGREGRRKGEREGGREGVSE